MADDSYMPDEEAVAYHGRHGNDISFGDGLVEIVVDRGDDKSERILIKKGDAIEILSATVIKLINPDGDVLQPAVLGTKLVEFLTKLAQNFIGHGHPSNGSPPIPAFTVPISVALTTLERDVLSQIVKLN